MEGILTKGPDPRLRGRLIACGQEAVPLLLCIHGGGCNGGYFDMRGFSVAQVATERGFDVLLIDRPGHGDSAPPRTLSPIAEAAELLPAYIASILAARASPHLVVIGHSIGGAVALLLAANGQTPIRGVAVSGIGRIPSDRASAWLAENAGVDLEPPPEFFFGPKGSYDWRGPLALRRVIEPWRADELDEVRVGWPARFDAVAGAVTVPVAFHLAEHECIWRADAAEVAAAASRFLRSQRIEAGILPEGGHLYELHKQGMKLTEQQLDFLIDACFDGKPK